MSFFYKEEESKDDGIRCKEKKWMGIGKKSKVSKNKKSYLFSRKKKKGGKRI
jgi:hypothetical protein